MSNRLIRGIKASLDGRPHIRNENSSGSAGVITSFPRSDIRLGSSTADVAMKLSAVDRCVEALSDSIGKLPVFIVDRLTRKRVVVDPILDLLTVRPNEAQTPTVFKKMLEGNRLCGGNGYALIIRDPRSYKPVELIPVPYELVTPILDRTTGHIWYQVTQPFTGEPMTVHREDMIHVMAYTYNGWKGVSVLQRASDVIAAARAAQEYNLNYYANGGQPSGVLQTDADLSGKKTVTNADGTKEEILIKDSIRAEWEKRHSGPTNAHRIAILDYGLKYTPISVSNRDAQFVEQNALSIEDIARFFGVPLYKLQAGKQSYSSNEQNAIEYVVGTLHPIVSQYEESLAFRLFTSKDLSKFKLRFNMMAELRGDNTSRANWYRTMRDIGVFSVNDILALEDMPDVEGGDERYASLNYVPLSTWSDISINRNKGENN